MLAKSLRLEIWDLVESDATNSIIENDEYEDDDSGPRIECKLEIPIRGRVVTMCSYTPPNRKGGLDYILYTTERKRYAIIAYNQATKKIETKASGSLRDAVGREKNGAPICIIDPESTIVVFQLYDGFLKIFPICQRTGLILERDEFRVRLPENSASSMCFLNTQKERQGGRKVEDYNPVIALLYQDMEHMFRATTYCVDLEGREIRDGPWSLRYENIDAFSCLLIPFRNSSNSVIIVGHKQLTYFNGNSSKSIPMEDKIILCYDQVDDNRFLLGDDRGTLWLLTVNQEKTGMQLVSGMSVEVMGSVHIPATITYISEGICFIGTQYGDSELLQLSEEIDIKKNSFIKSSTEYTALGPILDFDTVTTNHQQAIVTCNGMGKDGTLRIVRNGIGIHEQADVEISGITDLFSLHLPGQVYDKYLVQSFIHATRILAIADDEMAEDVIPGFLNEETTFWLKSTFLKRIGECRSDNPSMNWTNASN